MPKGYYHRKPWTKARLKIYRKKMRPYWEARARKCAVEGCKEKHHALGYCLHHYHHFLNKGMLPKAERCTVKGCDRCAYAKDLCRKHYARLKRRGDLGSRSDLPKKKCKVYGCKNPVRNMGYCAKHFCRWKAHGNCYKRRQGAPKGKANWKWRGGVSEYPNHATLKRNRLIKLAQVGWKCEVCGKKATQVHHKNRNRADHRIRNLKAVCCKCHGKFRRGFNGTSKYLREYGFTLKKMSALYGGSQAFYFYLHQKGTLKMFLKEAKRCGFTRKRGRSISKYVRLYGYGLKELADKFGCSMAIVHEFHVANKLGLLLKKYDMSVIRKYFKARREAENKLQKMLDNA